MPTIDNTSIVDATLSYEVGASAPAASIWWLDRFDNRVTLTSSTMGGEVFSADGTKQFTCAAVGAATGSGTGVSSADVPNVTVTWAAAAELSTLTDGNYTLVLTATDGTGRKRLRVIDLIIT